jgi:hypothetical protein
MARPAIKAGEGLAFDLSEGDQSSHIMVKSMRRLCGLSGSTSPAASKRLNSLRGPERRAWLNRLTDEVAALGSAIRLAPFVSVNDFGEGHTANRSEVAHRITDWDYTKSH